MRRVFFLVIISWLYSTSGFCQNTNKAEVIFKFEQQVIVFYDNQLLNIENFSDSTLSIGIVLHNNIYKSNVEESILAKYIDFNQFDQDILPVFFIFSEGMVSSIEVKKFKRLIRKKTAKFLYQINDKNFSKNINELNQLEPNQIDEIQMVKGFKLIKWDTREEDEFILFMIKTRIK